MVRKNEQNQSTLIELLKSLGGVIKGLNQLIPMFVVIFASLSFWLIYIIITYTKWRMGLTVIVVLLVSIIVYIRSKNYGEATLALVAGLLTVFTVDWDNHRFIIFMTVWIGFSLIAIMVSSVRIAAAVEDIYRQASLSIAGGSEAYKEIEKELKKIGDEVVTGTIGPVERAEIIRLLCFKKLPLNVISHALKAVGTISVITKVDIKTVAMFIADLYKVLETSEETDYNKVLDWIYILIRETPVPPIEFIEAFEKTRRLVLSKRIDLLEYFEVLKNGLESGVSEEDMNDYIINNI